MNATGIQVVKMADAFQGKVLDDAPGKSYQQELAEMLGIESTGIFPCTTEILLGVHQNSEFTKDRNNIKKLLFMIAGDLARLDIPIDRTTTILLNWNRYFPEPRKDYDIRDEVKRAYKIKDRYIYGCNHSCRRHFCSDKSHCSRYRAKELSEGEIKHNGASTFLLFWVDRLSSNPLRVYKAICSLERKNGLLPGMLLIISFKQVTLFTSVSLSAVAVNLKILKALDLLEYLEIGKQHKWDKAGKSRIEGTKVRRKIPIPKPPDEKTVRKIIKEVRDDEAIKAGKRNCHYVQRGRGSS